jgi:hypothetical protein
VYYRCTHRKVTPCSQRPIPLRDLERQIIAFLESITIPDEFHQWVLARLERWGDDEKERDTTSRESLQAAFDAVNRQLTKLTKLGIRELISDEDYAKEREALLAEKRRIAQRLEGNETADSWFEPARLLVSFSNRAVSWFSEGDLEIKRLILVVAGLNPTLLGRQLSIDARKPFRRWSKTPKIPAMSSILDDVRTLWLNQDQEFLSTVAALRRLSELVKSSGIARAA